ncbi:hypothetical protein HZA97_00365, partial [Candidatus Woesearchaeota archaeon]|nr:hypothetical protein [Candidatus Woesearchaeota archaeon]
MQKAYRKIALKCHPDRTTNLPEKERAVLEKNSKKLQTLM